MRLTVGDVMTAVWKIVPVAQRTVTLNSTSPGVLKSVQRGTITIGNGSTSNTATITSVDTSKAFIVLGGSTTTVGEASYRPDKANVRVVLTNATTVTATRETSDTATVTVAYQVVEFY